MLIIRRTIGLRLLVALVIAAALTACEPTNQGYAPLQPIAYSHAVHAGVNQIPCQYCHFGGERGRYAGIPPASICMNCHGEVSVEHEEVVKVQQALDSGEAITWQRVHKVPDHVYFDHSIHVSAAVECQECHGPMESMGTVLQWAPLTMGWCLDCHRLDDDPQEAADPVNVGRASRLVDCTNCHH